MSARNPHWMSDRNLYESEKEEKLSTDEMLELDSLVISLKSLIVSFQIFPVTVILFKVKNLPEHPT